MSECWVRLLLGWVVATRYSLRNPANAHLFLSQQVSSPWSCTILILMFKKFTAFSETEGALPHSHKPATGSHSDLIYTFIVYVSLCMLHVPPTEFKAMYINTLKHSSYEGSTYNVFWIHPSPPPNSPCFRLNVLSTLLSDNLVHKVHGSAQSDAL